MINSLIRADPDGFLGSYDDPIHVLNIAFYNNITNEIQSKEFPLHFAMKSTFLLKFGIVYPGVTARQLDSRTPSVSKVPGNKRGDIDCYGKRIRTHNGRCQP